MEIKQYSPSDLRYGTRLYNSTPDAVWMHIGSNETLDSISGMSSWLSSPLADNINFLAMTTPVVRNSWPGSIPRGADTDSTDLVPYSTSPSLAEALLLPNLKYLFVPQIDLKSSKDQETLDSFIDDLVAKISERASPCYVYIGRHQAKLEERLHESASRTVVEGFYNLKSSRPPLPDALLRVLAADLDPYFYSNEPRFVHFDLGADQERFNTILAKTWSSEKASITRDIVNLPAPIEMKPARFDQAEFKQTFVSNITKEIDALYIKFGVGIIKNLEPLREGQVSIAFINQAIQEAKKIPSPKTSSEKQAYVHFVNHFIIPNLDYFVAASLLIEGRDTPINWEEYPALAEAGGYALDPDKIANIRKLYAQASKTPQASAFSDILDHSKGSHFARLNAAMKLVDGSMGEFTGIYKDLQKAIEDAAQGVDMNQALRLVQLANREKAAGSNAFLGGRAEEMLLLAQAKVSASEQRNEMIGKLNIRQIGAYGLAKLTKGIPVIEGITEAIHESTGGHHTIMNRNAMKANLAVAKVEADAQRQVAEMLKGRMVDVDSIDRELEGIGEKIKELRQSSEMKAIAKDETKQRAIADAFVNKSVLAFGARMSQAMHETVQDQGLSSIDAFLEHYLSRNPRLGEALQNLAFGFADSNDLSVILSDASMVKPTADAHDKALKDFAESVMKPNIADLYSHGSKVDIIYQSNLSGLGSPFNAARVMIRSAHDVRLGALFSDAFGVESEMTQLTVRGALDVKNVFDFYLHRHGDKTMTDTKVRDGVFTGEHAKKRVSTVPQEAIDTHVEMVKSARGFRQSSPEISDMFLRICGYEYFYPQAFNAAQSTNIMNGNPEAPAAHVMANQVIASFVERLSFSSVEAYRAQVGEKLDNLIAQTFMDFFAELGNRHSADPELGIKRAELKKAAYETNSYGFVFDSYTKRITKDALGSFDLFLNIYQRNLEKQLETATDKDRKMLEEQIEAVNGMTHGILNPDVVKPGTQQALFRARLDNHLFENTLLGANMSSTKR